MVFPTYDHINYKVISFRRLIPGKQNGITFYIFRRMCKRKIFRFKIRFWNNAHHNDKPVGKWRYTIYLGPLHIMRDNSKLELGTHNRYLSIVFK